MAATMSGPSAASAPTFDGVPATDRRLIGVGIGQVRRDAAALRWAMSDARPGRDVVEVFHAVEPVDAEHSSGWDEIATAVQLAAWQRPGVAVIGSPMRGSPEQVLHTESDRLTLLVLREDDPATQHRRIAAHLRRSAACPVVCVPPGAEPIDELPVTVVADDVHLRGPARDFAAGYAARHRSSVQLTRAWSALHTGAPTADDTADTRTALPAEQARPPVAHPYAPITTRLELDRIWLQAVRADSSLLVVGPATATRLCHTAPEETEAASCPVAFLPDR